MKIASIVIGLLLAAGAQAQEATRPAKPGDVHVYSGHQKTDRVQYEETVTVTSVEPDRILTSHQRTDRPSPMPGMYGRDWSLVRSGSSGMQAEPPGKLLAQPLEVGKAWEVTYQGTLPSGAVLKVRYEAQVLAREKIKTPAGEFDAFRIAAKGHTSGITFRGDWPFEQTTWYAPSIDRIVRQEYRERRTLGADNVVELKEFKPAP